MITRRNLIAGFATLLAAPAIIRTPGLLMPIRPYRGNPRGFGGISVTGGHGFVVGDPIVFPRDMGAYGIVAGQTYYVTEVGPAPSYQIARAT